MNDHEAVIEGWRAFLGRVEWDIFLTVTFRKPRPPHHGESTLREVGTVIARECDRPFFLGTELHVNGNLHVHGLLKSVDGPDALSSRWLADSLWERFRVQFGRSQVRRVRDHEAVVNYCTKYVVKGFTTWDMRL